MPFPRYVMPITYCCVFEGITGNWACSESNASNESKTWRFLRRQAIVDAGAVNCATGMQTWTLVIFTVDVKVNVAVFRKGFTIPPPKKNLGFCGIGG